MCVFVQVGNWKANLACSWANRNCICIQCIWAVQSSGSLPSCVPSSCQHFLPLTRFSSSGIERFLGPCSLPWAFVVVYRSAKVSGARRKWERERVWTGKKVPQTFRRTGVDRAKTIKSVSSHLSHNYFSSRGLSNYTTVTGWQQQLSDNRVDATLIFHFSAPRERLQINDKVKRCKCPTRNILHAN